MIICLENKFYKNYGLDGAKYPHRQEKPCGLAPYFFVTIYGIAKRRIIKRKKIIFKQRLNTNMRLEFKRKTIQFIKRFKQ